MRYLTAVRIGTLATVVVAAAAAATAQQRGGPGAGMPRYDKATETTVSGTVDEVRAQQACCGSGGGGTHLTLATPDGTFDVHVGPTRWLTSKQFSVAKGDRLDVIGSKVTIGGQEALIARQVTRDGTSIVLRNENGFPLWAGGRNLGR